MHSKQVSSQNLEEGVTYETEDLLGDTSEYWSGCYTINEGWAGLSGGQCPTINDQYGGQINYGYLEQTLTNIAAIDEALKGVGLETTGYTYSWRVKNYDAEYVDQSVRQGFIPDYFIVTVKIVDSNQNVVFEKQYNYSFRTPWFTDSGSEVFDEPFDLDSIDEVQLSITGRDIGYWAGYYGPEFGQPDIRLQYRLKAQEDTTVDDLLFSQSCQQDPLYDISCPGYNDAMLDMITSDSSIDSLETELAYNSTSEDESISESAIPEQQENVDNVVEETSPVEVAEKESKNLSSDQLLALDIAEGATQSAQSVAAAASQQGSTSGLSADGTLSTELLSDGISNSDGSLQEFVENSVGSQDNVSENSDQSNTQEQNTNQQESENLNENIAQNLETTINQGQILNEGLENDIALNDINTSDTQVESSETIETETTNEQRDTFEIAALDVGQLNSLDINNPIINEIVNGVTDRLVREMFQAAEDIAEESAEESYEELNEKENELVNRALQGDDSEEAQAALLGYNPAFRQYQQPQMPDSNFYQPRDIYESQKNYDNPNQRFFNGASDVIHDQMVRQQYERN